MEKMRCLIYLYTGHGKHAVGPEPPKPHGRPVLDHRRNRHAQNVLLGVEDPLLERIEQELDAAVDFFEEEGPDDADRLEAASRLVCRDVELGQAAGRFQ